MSIHIIYAGGYEVQAVYVDGQKTGVFTSPNDPDLGEAMALLRGVMTLPEATEVRKFGDQPAGFDVYNPEAWPATLADALRMLGKEAAQPVNERTEL